jgi:hypothetical protein
MGTGWEALMNRRGGPRWEPVTPDNCDIDGSAYGWQKDGLDWPNAEFRQQSLIGELLGWPDDPHIRVPWPEWETSHRVRGKRVRMLDARPAPGSEE